MTFDYTRMQATATRLINRFGTDASLEKAEITGPEYDPVLAFTPYAIRVVDEKIRIRDVTGATDGTTARVLTVAVSEVSPAKGDWVTVRGQRHRIGSVMPLAPGGIDLLYECELEG